MHSTSDFHKGLQILIDDEPYSIVDFQHHKPGKGNSVTKAKLKNLVTGSNLEKTFKSGEKFGQPDVEYKEMNFLYSDEIGFNFMDQVSYEQISLDKDIVGDSAMFLKENLTTKICFFNERAVGIELPKTVELVVSQTDPGFKGNTVSNTTKPATLETSAIIQVPLHINEGDLLRVNTESKEYVERVNK